MAAQAHRRAKRLADELEAGTTQEVAVRNEDVFDALVEEFAARDRQYTWRRGRGGYHVRLAIQKGQRVIHENGTHGVAGIRDPRHNGVVRYMPDVLYLPDGAPRDTGWIWVPEAYLRLEKAA